MGDTKDEYYTMYVNKHLLRRTNLYVHAIMLAGKQRDIFETRRTVFYLTALP